jgi:hypothetical protein
MDHLVMFSSKQIKAPLTTTETTTISKTKHLKKMSNFSYKMDSIRLNALSLKNVVKVSLTDIQVVSKLLIL